MRKLVVHIKDIKRSPSYGEPTSSFGYESELQDFLNEPFGGVAGINIYSDEIVLIAPMGMRHVRLYLADPYLIEHLVETYGPNTGDEFGPSSTYTSEKDTTVVDEIVKEILEALQ